MIKFIDLAGNVVYVRPSGIVAILIPSVIASGDGKCKVILPGAISDVSRSVAEQLAADVGMAEPTPSVIDVAGVRN